MGARRSVSSPEIGRVSRGVSQILRFNWPWYAASLATTALGGTTLLLTSLPSVPRTAVAAGTALALYWGLASLLASYWIYDLSGLYDFAWLEPLFDPAPRSWVNVHAGFDNTSATLQRLFPVVTPRILDIYQAAVTTEASIDRARRSAQRPLQSSGADPRAFPLPDESADAIFVIFSAHEIRDPEARLAFFRELARVLARKGKIVLLEHPRDLPNFLVFGPGVRHFLPKSEWLRLLASSYLSLENSFTITPFVRVFLATWSGKS